jgi:hypothetical protein
MCGTSVPRRRPSWPQPTSRPRAFNVDQEAAVGDGLTEGAVNAAGIGQGTCLPGWQEAAIWLSTSQAGDLDTDVREVLHCELFGLAATHARPFVMQPQELPYLVE